MNDSLRKTPVLAARLWASPYLLLTLTALFWAGNTIVGRAARGDVPPVTLTLLRWVVALALLLPFAWRRLRHDRAALLAAWRPLLVLSLFGIAGYNSLGYTGLKMTTALNAGLLQAAMTPFTVIFAFLFFRERPRSQVLAGILISALGLLAVVSAGSLHTLLHLRLNAGDAFVIAGLASYAVYTVWLRRAPKVHPLSLLAVTFALGSLILVPFAVAESLRGETVRWGATAIGGIAYVAIFPSLVAYLMFNRGVQLIGAARATQFVYLIPIFGAVMAVTFLGETLHLYHWIGGGLIAAGIVVASRRKGAA